MSYIPTRATATTLLIFSNYIFLSAQIEIPVGTRFNVRMDNGISSDSSVVDDTFTAETVEPMKFGDSGTIPAKTVVTGTVTHARAAAGGGRPGKLEVDFIQIRFPDGSERKLSAVLVKRLAGEDPGPLNTAAILGGTAIGGVIGWISRAKNGPLVGAGIGAGAGTGIALSRRGKNVGIDSNEDFEIELTQALSLPADGF